MSELAVKLDQPAAAAGSQLERRGARRGVIGGGPNENAVLPTKAKGALTPRCAVALDHEKSRRQGPRLGEMLGTRLRRVQIGDWALLGPEIEVA